MKIWLPFAHDVSVRTEFRGRRKSRTFRSYLCVEIADVSASELSEAIRVRWLPGDPPRAYDDPAVDVVMRYGGRLYRRAEHDGDVLTPSDLEKCLADDRDRRVYWPQLHLPPPPSWRTVANQHRTLTSLQTMDAAERREGWTLRAVLADNVTERRNEAYLHYADAFIVVDGVVYAQCPEPVWHVVIPMWGDPLRLRYWDSPTIHSAELQFELDAIDEVEDFIGAQRPGATLATERAAIELFDVPTPRQDPLIRLAQAALAAVPEMSKARMRAIGAGVDMSDQLSALKRYYRGGRPITTEDADPILDMALDVERGIGPHILPKYRLDTIHQTMTTIRHRLPYLREKAAQALDADDLAAMLDIF